jgi:mandelate racemase
VNAAKLTIRHIRARPVMVPFKRPPVAASGALSHATLVLIDLETDDGITGRSYVFGFSAWALKPIVACVDAIREMLAGDPLAPADVDAKIRKNLTLLGTPGLVGLAHAGVDMCAWDALAQAAGLPLVKLLGGNVGPVRAYNSCGLWIMPVDQLADDAEALVGEGNFSAIKLRVGRENPADDVAAARAVKKRVGDTITVMCDFNQRLTVNDAIERGRMLDAEGLAWIEEPVRHDDYAGCARIAAELSTPVQIGENLLNTFELIKALEARAMDYVMPDVQRIGGVTGWLRAAAIAHAYGMDMSSHLFPEYSAHLLAVTPTRHWLEYIDWADPILEEPLQIRDGNALIPARSGSGISWNEDAVKRYAVA